MPPPVEQGAASTPRWLPQARTALPGAEPQPEHALEGREVESAPPERPRHRVLHALLAFGKSLSRKLAVALPSCARASRRDRAKRETRYRLELALGHLAAGKPSAAAFTAHLRELAEGWRKWLAFDPRAEQGLDHLLRQVLEEPLEAARGLALSEALSDLSLREERQGGTPSKTPLERLWASVAQAATERALVSNDLSLMARIGRGLLERALRRLASGQADSTALTVELYRLARVLQQLERSGAPLHDLHPFLESLLDERWPGDRALTLAKAVRGEPFRQALRCLASQEALAGNPSGQAAKSVAERIAQSIVRVVSERAHATIANNLAIAMIAIRDHHAGNVAQKAFADALVIAGQLRESLPAATDRGGPDTGQRPRSSAADALEMLESSLERLGPARDVTVDELVRRVDLETLMAFPSEPLAHGPLGRAIEAEVRERPPRLMSQLEAEIAVESIGPRSRSTGTSGSAPGSAPSPPRSAQQTDSPATGRPPARLETLKMEAHASIEALANRLAEPEKRGRLAGCLGACKDMVKAVEAYLKATGGPGINATQRSGIAGADEDEFSGQFSALLQELVTRREVPGRARKVFDVLQGDDLRTLQLILGKAGDQAARAGLTELHTELRHVRQALEAVEKLAEKRSGAHRALLQTLRRASLEDTRQLPLDARDALKRLFSIAIEADGQLRLTAGRCSASFTEHMARRVRPTFSEGELAENTLAGGTAVPHQFVRDAQRDGTEFWCGGEPLIDKRRWSELTLEQKHSRIEAGYLRLLEFYEGDKTATDAILRNANQTLVMSIVGAMSDAGDASPVRFEGRPVVIQSGGLNGTHNTLIHFGTGDGHVPRLRLTYEVLGGFFLSDLQLKDDPRVHLDLDRSWARITFDAEVNADRTGLRLTGTPTYDVQLELNWAQRPYPLPQAKHLLVPSNADELYSDLIAFAAAEQPGRVSLLEAIRRLRSMQTCESDDFSHRLRDFYDSHLAPGARQPLGASIEDLQVVRRIVESGEAPVEDLFSTAEVDAVERLRQLAQQHLTHDASQRLMAGDPSALNALPQSRRPEAARLIEFRGMTAEWRRAPHSRRAIGASIFQSFLTHNDRDPLFGVGIRNQILQQVQQAYERTEAARPSIRRLLHELMKLLPQELFTAFARHVRLSEEHARTSELTRPAAGPPSPSIPFEEVST